jgi:acyl-coenzyme A thioesterase PaaI-like protein
MDKIMEFTVPEGFTQLQGLPPAYDYGKFCVKKNENGEYDMGFYIRPEHIRHPAGHAGGGILLTAADYLMGFVLYKKLFKGKEAEFHPTTTSMTTDFLGNPKLGDWVTAKVEVLKIGRQVCTVQCLFSSNEKPILRASASYVLVSKGST